MDKHKKQREEVVQLLPGSDCGTAKFKYLSHNVAKQYREKNMPHEIQLVAATNTDGLPVLASRKHPLWATQTGYHPCCARRSRSDLDQYGSGVVLYFKLLKWGFWLFFVLSLLYVPALVLFYSGDAQNGSGTSGGGAYSVVTALSQFTLGNLGEATTTCADGYEADAAPVTVTCPAGTRILRLEAWYGDVAGSCSCPRERTPAPTCSGTANDDVCVPRGSYCHQVVSRPVSMPDGSRWSSGACCAASLSAGREDFSDLDFTVNAGCQSDREVVNAIVGGVCLGKDSCTLATGRNASQQWSPSLEFGTRCPYDTGRLDPKATCSATLGQVGAGWSVADSATSGSGSSTSSSTSGYAVDGLAVCGGPLNSSTTPVTSLASPAYRARGARLVVVAQCYRETIRPLWWQPQSPPLSKQTVALTIVGMEVAICLAFIAAFLCLMRREAQADNKSITAANYTVIMTHLPPHDNLLQLEGELRSHLEATLTSQPKVVADVTKVAVADINFALGANDLIHLFIARGQLLLQIERLSKVALVSERSMVVDPGGRPLTKKDGSPLLGKDGRHSVSELKLDEGIEDRFKRTVQFISRLRRRLAEIDTKIDAAEAAAASAHNYDLRDHKAGKKQRRSAKAAAAFVTFEEEEGVQRALQAYPATLWGWLCQPRALRYRGQYRLWLQRAPEPSDIRWENYSTSRVGYAFRRLVSVVMIIGILMLAAYGIFTADNQKKRAVRQYPDVSCSSLSGEVSDKDAVLKDVYWAFYANATTGNTGRLGCYCKHLLSSGGVSAVIDDTFAVPPSWERENLCGKWFTTYATSQLLIYGTSVLILFFNVVLRVVISYLVQWERHTTITSELTARGVYLFMVQLINTGGLILLLNAFIQTDFALLRSGNFWDFTQGWYTSVGTSICLTMLLQVVTVHVSPLVFGVYKSAARCWDRGCTCDRGITRTKVQNELNMLYLGIDFAIDERYAQLFTAIFVNLLYCTGGISKGLPLLMPTLAAMFALMYPIDKWLFLRHYNTPPQYDSHLSGLFTSLLPFALVLHLAFGVWQLSAPDIFGNPVITQLVSFARSFSDTSAGDKASGIIERGMAGARELHVGQRLTT